MKLGELTYSRPTKSVPNILPRKREVAPKATEGEDTERTLSSASPSVWRGPATSPWRGRIVEGGVPNRVE